MPTFSGLEPSHFEITWFSQSALSGLSWLPPSSPLPDMNSSLNLFNQVCKQLPEKPLTFHRELLQGHQFRPSSRWRGKHSILLIMSGKTIFLNLPGGKTYVGRKDKCVPSHVLKCQIKLGISLVASLPTPHQCRLALCYWHLLGAAPPLYLLAGWVKCSLPHLLYPTPGPQGIPSQLTFPTILF